MTAVCSTRNVELARSLGADRVVDYTQEDFTQLGERHDLMLDIAGSRPFREFRRVLTPEATVVIVGAKFPSNKGHRASVPHHRNAFGLGGQEPDGQVLHREDQQGGPRLVLQELLEAGKVRSVIDRRYELSQTADALRYLGEGHARGKVVITV